MKVSRLMEHHRKFASQGLPESFGDGFLVAHNRFFRQVRKAAMGSGFHFSCERNDAYEAFPLLQLESLLQRKTLPYAKNIAAFDDLPTASLNALSWSDIDGNLKKNFVFHEGCHAAVRTLTNRILGPLPFGQELESQRQFALRMLTEESSANAIELLGVSEIGDPIHRIFFEMNSYMGEFESRATIKNALTELGDVFVIKFLILSYLQSNFLRSTIDERGFKTMLRIASTSFDSGSRTGAEPSAKAHKTLRALSKIAFRLSERFRLQTTSFHLRLAGIDTPLEELFAFDFLATLEKNDSFRRFFQEFAHLFPNSQELKPA